MQLPNKQKEQVLAFIYNTWIQGFQDGYYLRQRKAPEITPITLVIIKWLPVLFFLCILSLPAVLFLSIGDLSDYLIARIINRICISIIASTVMAYLCFKTSSTAFLAAIPFIIILSISSVFYDKVKGLYIRQYGKPSSPDVWICKKCGEENSNISLECFNCAAKKAQ